MALDPKKISSHELVTWPSGPSAPSFSLADLDFKANSPAKVAERMERCAEDLGVFGNRNDGINQINQINGINRINRINGMNGMNGMCGTNANITSFQLSKRELIIQGCKMTAAYELYRQLPSQDRLPTPNPRQTKRAWERDVSHWRQTIRQFHCRWIASSP
eukprot:s414_g18.t1